MADKKLNSITFPGIADRYILDSGHVEYDPTEVYSDGTVGKALNDKANINGYYENLGSGYADNLATDIRAASQVPYNFQTAGGSVDIGDREYLNAVVGGSLPINQLYNYTSGGTNKGLTFNIVNGVVSISGTTNDTGSSIPFAWTTFTIPKGHKVLIMKDFDLIGNDIIMEQYNLSSSTSAIDKVINCTAGYIIPQLKIDAIGHAYSISNKHLMVFDLTLMLGSAIADYIYTIDQATAGAGVAWCKAHFPKIFNSGYIAYNAGTMEHVTGVSSHDTIGFNQWDEVWEQGAISVSSGQNTTGSNIRSKNYIPILPNTTYYLKIGLSTVLYHPVIFYDENKNFISASAQQLWNRTITTPDNATYMRFYINSSYGTTYKNDICINISWDGSRNGEYEAYVKRSYALDSTLTLRGVPKLDASNNLYYDGDVYAYDGTVTRKYGIVDLGTLNWGTPSASGRTSATPSPLGKTSANIPNIISSKYVAMNRTTWYNADGGNGITITGGGYGGDGNIGIVDSAFIGKTAEQVKSALSGVYVTYELATPTTESADPYQQVQIVDDFGTEEFVTSGIIPIGHSSEYPVNLKAKLEMTPDSPSGGNGDYVVQQASGINSYVPLGSTDTITGIIARIEALENA